MRSRNSSIHENVAAKSQEYTKLKDNVFSLLANSSTHCDFSPPQAYMKNNIALAPSSTLITTLQLYTSIIYRLLTRD